MRRVLGIRRVTAVWIVTLLIVSMAAGFAYLAGAVWPVASGDKRYSDGALTVDASHMQSGYIMVSGPETQRKLKVRVTKGEDTLTYDLNKTGDYEVLPLQLGSGSYTCTLYKNVSGNKYSQAGKVKLKAELEDENAAFLCPNQYVSYTADSAAVQLSMEICEGLTTDREKYEAIRDYLKRNFMYDFVKAATVAPGTMPDIDHCLTTRMGICQDLAALAACMLRVQGIPTRMIIGYADNNYHAWNSVHLDGETITLDLTAEVRAISKNVTYTVERYY